MALFRGGQVVVSDFPLQGLTRSPIWKRSAACFELPITIPEDGASAFARRNELIKDKGFAACRLAISFGTKLSVSRCIGGRCCSVV